MTSIIVAVITGITCIVVAMVNHEFQRRQAERKERRAIHGEIRGYKYYDLPWVKPFHRSCGARFSIYSYFGRCELQKNHGEIPHAAERGMEWVRFDNQGCTWITFAGDQNQSLPEIIRRKE